MGESSVLSQKAVAPGAKAVPDTAAKQLDKAVGSSEAQSLERFLQLAEKGPPDAASAPSSVELPSPTLKAMVEAMAEAFNDGLEHGGLIGKASDGTFTILKGKGEDNLIDLSKIKRPAGFRSFAVFHTHLYVTSAGDNAGWSGGGFSGDDIANHFRREERVSLLTAMTKEGRNMFFMLLKPQTYTIRGLPGKVGKEYDARVIAKVGKGADPIDASIAELSALARDGAFAFYSGFESRSLTRK